ncbi:hypothetical protein EGR_09669 [Echinococcus granulosus]|uniref:Uncharacterized protein n=1 Tax=Echinococcus granulosus TaxID=6210 RepID=W6U4K0_ECHGR|nr:hypothetical protein EGR_09669 [Echinococcus granulosus]EUB55461.1 hypothetical protein EGR_09669 [Echinococcus granulosus]
MPQIKSIFYRVVNRVLMPVEFILHFQCCDGSQRLCVSRKYRYLAKASTLLLSPSPKNETDEQEQCTRLPQSKPPHTDEGGQHPLTADAAPPQEEASNTPTGEKLLSAAFTDPSQVELVDLVLKEQHLLNQLTYLFRMPSASQGVRCVGLKPFSVDQFLGLISTNSMTDKRSKFRRRLLSKINLRFCLIYCTRFGPLSPSTLNSATTLVLANQLQATLFPQLTSPVRMEVVKLLTSQTFNRLSFHRHSRSTSSELSSTNKAHELKLWVISTINPHMQVLKALLALKVELHYPWGVELQDKSGRVIKFVPCVGCQECKSSAAIF